VSKNNLEQNVEKKLVKINLGCGKVILPEFINVDSIELPGVNVLHDVNDLPLPFDDASASEIHCISILEHVDFIPLLQDLYRILTSGGTVEILVPHFSSPDAYRDPTHIRYFTAGSFDFFVTGHKRDYYFDFRFNNVSHKIQFEKRKLFFYNYALEWLVNLSHDMQSWYEKTPLRAFPAQGIRITLTK
jgi:hypothetical protein